MAAVSLAGSCALTARQSKDPRPVAVGLTENLAKIAIKMEMTSMPNKSEIIKSKRQPSTNLSILFYFYFCSDSLQTPIVFLLIVIFRYKIHLTDTFRTVKPTGQLH